MAAWHTKWACPDLGKARPEGREMPVPGSHHAWPDCPAYYLRTAGTLLPAAHLVDGAHPAAYVGERLLELEAGGITADDMTARVHELVQLMRRERDAFREADMKRGREARK